LTKFLQKPEYAKNPIRQRIFSRRPPSVGEPTAEEGGDCTLAFGGFIWKDYDFACEGKQIGGRGELGIVYHVTNNGRDDFILGRWDGTCESVGSMDSEGYQRLKWRKTSQLEDGRWYKLRVRIRGARFLFFVDDKHVFDIEVARNPQGSVGLRT
jgi:hypothetical protein